VGWSIKERSGSFGKFYKPYAFMFPDMKIHCTGTIIQWNFYRQNEVNRKALNHWDNRIASAAIFRPTEDSTQWYLIDYVQMSRDPQNGPVSITVDPDKNNEPIAMKVQKGDVIGVIPQKADHFFNVAFEWHVPGCKTMWTAQPKEAHNIIGYREGADPVLPINKFDGTKSAKPIPFIPNGRRGGNCAVFSLNAFVVCDEE